MFDVMVAKGIRLLEQVLGVKLILRQYRAVCKRVASWDSAPPQLLYRHSRKE